MAIDGIILIDKPEGISSASVVWRVKRKLGAKKVGHTGTLDPFATGLMICGINKGTKLSQFFLGGSKHYIAQIVLGVQTDTYDYTGQLINKYDQELLPLIPHQTIIEAVNSFKGVQMQHPPVYSALKHKGKPLYQLAREGNPVNKPPRKIEIHSIDVHSIEIRQNQKISNDRQISCISVALTICCSAGTYIRSLAHDIGQQLACGGCLLSLRRTQTCGFSIQNAVSLEHFENMADEEANGRIIPMEETLPFMPVINADSMLVEDIRFGRTFRLNSTSLRKMGSLHKQTPSAESNYNFKVVDTNRKLIAIVEYNEAIDKYYYCCVFAN